MGSVVLGSGSLSASQNSAFFERRLYIANQTGGGSGNSIGTQVISTGSNIVDDFRGGTLSTLSIDWTQNVWIMLSGFVNNSADTLETNGIKAYKY